MDNLFWLVITATAYFSVKGAKSSRSRKLFIGLYALIFIIGFAYLSGESIGEAFYYFKN